MMSSISSRFDTRKSPFVRCMDRPSHKKTYLMSLSDWAVSVGSAGWYNRVVPAAPKKSSRYENIRWPRLRRCATTGLIALVRNHGATYRPQLMHCEMYTTPPTKKTEKRLVFLPKTQVVVRVFDVGFHKAIVSSKKGGNVRQLVHSKRAFV